MAPVQAVLFDLDGVLVRSEGAWLPLVRQTAQALGHPPPDAAAFAASFGQGVAADIAHFFPGERGDTVARFYVDHFADHRAHLEVDPDAAEVLGQVRARGFRTAVVTNTPTALAERMLGLAGLPPPPVFGAGPDRRDKPAPDLVLAALGALGVQADRAVLVGDSRYDREAAQAAGCRFIGVRLDGERRIEHLRELLDLLPARG